MPRDDRKPGMTCAYGRRPDGTVEPLAPDQITAQDRYEVEQFRRYLAGEIGYNQQTGQWVEHDESMENEVDDGPE